MKKTSSIKLLGVAFFFFIDLVTFTHFWMGEGGGINNSISFLL